MTGAVGEGEGLEVPRWRGSSLSKAKPSPVVPDLDEAAVVLDPAASRGRAATASATFTVA